MTPTPKRPLEIGERVSAASVFVGDKNTRIWRGTVLQVSGDWIEIRRDGQGDNDHCAFHRRQVRRLVKRKRRTYWAKSAELHDMTCTSYVCPTLYRTRPNNDYDVELVESKPRKEGV
jgi:hypothetical protein